MATRLSEEFFLAEATAARVDRPNGVIRGVKILGKESKNDNGKRVYSDAAMADAAKLYEGVGVNFNHPAPHEAARDRTFDEAAGWLSNVKHTPDGIFGDLNVLVEHPHAGMLFEAAERNPARFGLSHNSEGDVRREANGINLVHRVNRVRSVDVVHKPATNHSLFESLSTSAGQPTMKTIKLAELLEGSPDAKKLYQKFSEGYACKEDDEMSGDAGAVPMSEDDDVDVPDDSSAPPSGGSGSGDMSSVLMAVLQLVMKVLGKSQKQQERMRESLAGMKKTMESKFGPDAVQGEPKDMSATQYDASGAPGPGGAKGTGPAPKKTQPYQESVEQTITRLLTPLMEQVKEIKGASVKSAEETEVRALFESMNRECDDFSLRAVLAQPKADRKALIERLPLKDAAGGGGEIRRGRTIRPQQDLTESTRAGAGAPEVKIPSDPKDLASTLQRGSWGRPRATVPTD